MTRKMKWADKSKPGDMHGMHEEVDECTHTIQAYILRSCWDMYSS
jgi:hypothetical protein